MSRRMPKNSKSAKPSKTSASSKGAKPAKAAKPAAKSAKSGGAAKSAAKPAQATKRKVNPALMRPVQFDETLAAIVGSKPIPRGELTKRIWDHIKKNNLQDPKNRRQINADDALKAVFGGKKKVTMFEMTKLVNDHITGFVDK
jgi:upstream activation factor subunit UAF30